MWFGSCPIVFPNEGTSSGIHLYKSASPIACITEHRVVFVLIYNNLEFIEAVLLLSLMYIFEYRRRYSEYFVESFSSLTQERISLFNYS